VERDGRVSVAAEREALGDAVLECAPVGIAACDRDLRWVSWNAAMEGVTGIAARDALGALVDDAPCALAGEAPRAVLSTVLNGVTVDLGDVPLGDAAEPRTRWAAVRWSPHRGPEGEVAGAVVVVQDVTARRRDDAQALRLAAIPRESPNPVIECDPHGEVIYANPATGHVVAEVGTPLEDGFLPRNHRQLVAAALATGQPMRTVEVDVDDRVFSWTYHPHPQLGVVHLFADDITARRAVEDQLRHDALHDALTGLPNRHLFMERLARAVLQERRREGYLFAVPSWTSTASRW